MKLPVALQLYSVRNELEADFEGTLKKVKDIGYDGVEFAGLYGKSADEVKRLLNELDLVPVSAHVPIDDLLNNTDYLLDTYKTIGCKYVAIPYLMPERRPGTDGFEGTIKDIKKIAIAAKEKDIVLLYHNHDFEFIKIDGEYALDILYNTIPKDLLQTELDTCWVNIGGENPSDYIKKYSDRTPVVHLKDFYKEGRAGGALYKLIGVENNEEQSSRGSFEFRANGYGLQNFPSILAASKDSGAEWFVVEQDEPSMGKSPIECAAMSFDYINSINI